MKKTSFFVVTACLLLAVSCVDSPKKDEKIGEALRKGKQYGKAIRAAEERGDYDRRDEIRAEMEKYAEGLDWAQSIDLMWGVERGYKGE